MNPPRISPLGQRFDEVTSTRDLSDHRWALAAGYSKNYVAVLRGRAADEVDYALPEKTAAALAAAAGVHVEWLRYGRGPRDLSVTAVASTAPTVQAMTREPRECELALAEAFQRGLGRYSARDFLATLDLIREGELMLPNDREKAVLAAGRLLGVVSKLRRSSRPVTSDTIAGELLAAADDANAEGLAQLAALGAAPPPVPVRTPARGTPAVPRAPKAIVRDGDHDADEESGARPRFKHPDAAAVGTRRR